MSYQVSARKYRPQAFEEVVGQPHIVRTLTNAITSGRIAHAYLFSGIRGVGKTTIARIFARALNCEHGPTPTPCNTCVHCAQIISGNASDVLEIDGASNNSVDNIRDLSDNIRYRPLTGRYKVYIIDEVHMLSTQAFNALLKTLEEPPDHAVFVFATTETHKIPQTILSRCQHHAFRRVSREEIAGHLSGLATRDGIHAPKSAVALLAQAADGSLRDSLSLFDQAVSFSGGGLVAEDISLMLGVVGQPTLHGFAGDILAADPGAALMRLKALVEAGQDLNTLTSGLVEHFRNLLVCRVADDPAALIDLSMDDVAELSTQAASVPPEMLDTVFDLLAEAQDRSRRAAAPRFVLEAALVRACDARALVSLTELAARLEAAAGGAAPARADLPPRTQRPLPTSPPRQMVTGATPSAPQAVTPQAAAPQAVAPQAVTPQAVTPQAAAPQATIPAASQFTPPAAEAPREMIAGASTPPRQSPPEALEPSHPMVSDPAMVSAASASPREAWTAVVREIKTRRPALASYLEQGAVHSATPHKVEVAFQPAYEVMLSMVNRPDNLAFITDMARRVTGREMTVAFVIAAPGSDGHTTLGEQFEAEEQARHREEVEATMELPFIRDVIDTFGGEVVELHKPEP